MAGVMWSDDPIELEAESGLEPVADERPRMPEPLAVRVVAIEDIRLPALAGVEVELDRFWVGVLKFEREFARERVGEELVYRADNFSIRFWISEMLPQRGEYRPVVVQVQNLLEVEHKLID